MAYIFSVYNDADGDDDDDGDDTNYVSNRIDLDFYDSFAFFLFIFHSFKSIMQIDNDHFNDDEQPY